MFSWFGGKRKELVFGLILFVFFLAVLGCGKTKLTQAKAEKIIKEHEKFPIPVEGKLDIGGNIYAYVDTDALKSMYDKGLIKYQFVRNFGLSEVVNVGLTDEGKKYVKMDSNGKCCSGKRDWPHKNQIYVLVNLCEKDFLKVTGIKFVEGPFEKGAEVDYQWRYSNFTPFGLLWKESSWGGTTKFDEKTIYNNEALFVLYDDGWRVEKD